VPGLEPSTVRATSRRQLAVIGLGAVVLAAVLRLVLDVHLAAAIAFAYLAFLAVSYLTYRALGGRRVGLDVLLRGLVYGTFVLAILPLVSLLWTVLVEGIPLAFQSTFWTQDMSGVTGADDAAYADG